MTRFSFAPLAALLVLLVSACAPHEQKNREISVEGNRAVVSVPACPDWSDSHNSNFSNGTFSNFGCAHATNLVKMVEDPADLVAPEATGGPDAERNVNAIQEYRAPSSASEEGSAESASGTTSGGS